MLPYTPLHHLLLDDFGGALVLTSGNRSDEPIAYEDEEARTRLAEIADLFLTHDRPIYRRWEDSVVRGLFPVLRSRGYVPKAGAAGRRVTDDRGSGRGAEEHVLRRPQRRRVPLPHLGDLDSELAYRAFGSDLELYLAMLVPKPRSSRTT